MLYIAIALMLCVPAFAWADETEDAAFEAAQAAEDTTTEEAEAAAAAAREGERTGTDNAGLTLSSDNLSATIDGVTFALNDFTRASAGSNQDVDDQYFGYTYYIGKKPSDVMYVATFTDVVVYVSPSAASRVGFNISSEEDLANLQALLEALSKANENGSRGIAKGAAWHFISEEAINVDGVAFGFDRELQKGYYYNTIIGADGSDITQTTNPHYTQFTHASFASLVATEDAAIVDPPTTVEKLQDFFATLDWSPLWVTLKTTSTAIVFIFVLGLAAAYLTLHVSPRMRDILDTIFTIPMVLPPTVCGFLLLLLLGTKTPIGQWFASIGFPLVFSWPATVIAATVVAFPLMYRNARGAFENLDTNMLDAARTLGWSEKTIFFKLMLPLSWSSIAAGTVLAFARALGEYGATLFLAGNYVGITRTIPISIYFYWKIGRTDVAIFWTIVVLVFSFVVILFINLWSQHTTRYRRGAVEE